MSLDPSRYRRLSAPMRPGQSDGIYLDTTNNSLIAVLADTTLATITTLGISADPEIPSEARGDIMRRGASAWEVLPASTSGQILVGDGTDLVSVALTGATLSAAGALSGVLRASLAQDDLKPYPVDLARMRVHDALATFLPTTAADDDMGLIPGTFGTHFPTLQGVDFGGTSTDEKCRFQFRLPAEYVSGETVVVRMFAGMLTTISDGTATVDVECYKHDGAGLVGSDICATAAQDINSLTLAYVNFTITPTGLVAGDELDIRLSFAGSDVGDLGVMTPTITEVILLCDVKG